MAEGKEISRKGGGSTVCTSILALEAVGGWGWGETEAVEAGGVAVATAVGFPVFSTAAVVAAFL